ncbi:MAG: hypothetical protein H8M99_01545 [Gloeobacteraceae cyanobacterium ES-bin-144]|nr:hypothetical protein [Verrucomicrobiales bacterium]
MKYPPLTPEQLAKRRAGARKALGLPAKETPSGGSERRLVVPWPDSEDYDGETAQLMRTCEHDWPTARWQWVADQINAEYGNNRSAEACRKKWDVEIRKEIARVNQSRHNAIGHAPGAHGKANESKQGG